MNIMNDPEYQAKLADWAATEKKIEDQKFINKGDVEYITVQIFVDGIFLLASGLGPNNFVYADWSHFLLFQVLFYLAILRITVRALANS